VVYHKRGSIREGTESDRHESREGLKENEKTMVNEEFRERLKGGGCIGGLGKQKDKRLLAKRGSSQRRRKRDSSLKKGVYVGKFTRRRLDSAIQLKPI